MTNASTVSQYPTTIILEAGATLEGRFKHLARGHTRDGDERAIAVIEVDGDERALWLHETALRGQFRQLKPEPGETVRVEKGSKKRESGNRFKYWPFKVTAPKRPAADLGWDDELLGGDDGDVGAASRTTGGAAGPAADDVPF
jgi:hypothetical protein